jgi:CheY-like chemotaxis protein
MVVDDSLLVRQQVSRALTHARFAVVEALDGVDALAKLAQLPVAFRASSRTGRRRMVGEGSRGLQSGT